MAGRRLIVNADDFGWSEGVSAGILRAHREGIVSSTTLMVNMPTAEKAVELLSSAKALGVGVHLNLCQGPPLTEAAREALAGPDGRMEYKAGQLARRYLACGRVRRAVAEELEAQILWARQHGLAITHLDSHRHVHAFPPIFSLVCRLAERYKVAWIRWPVERLAGQALPGEARGQRSVVRQLRMMMLLNGLRLRRPGRADAFFGIGATGFLDSQLLRSILRCVPRGLSELMVHPGLMDSAGATGTRLVASREAELAALCDPQVRLELETQGIELTHYGTL